jgi:hypothetical protein
MKSRALKSFLATNVAFSFGLLSSTAWGDYCTKIENRGDCGPGSWKQVARNTCPDRTVTVTLERCVTKSGDPKCDSTATEPIMPGEVYPLNCTEDPGTHESFRYKVTGEK